MPPLGVSARQLAQHRRRRIEMMQHAAAIDVIEEAEIEFGETLQRGLAKLDIAEAADLGPGAGDIEGGGGNIEMNDLRLQTARCQLAR